MRHVDFRLTDLDSTQAWLKRAKTDNYDAAAAVGRVSMEGGGEAGGLPKGEGVDSGGRSYIPQRLQIYLTLTAVETLNLNSCACHTSQHPLAYTILLPAIMSHHPYHSLMHHLSRTSLPVAGDRGRRIDGGDTASRPGTVTSL